MSIADVRDSVLGPIHRLKDPDLMKDNNPSRVSGVVVLLPAVRTIAYETS
jgi:hypothetical protein